MLFNSYIFLFAFLPVVLIGFYGLGRYSHFFAMLWLTLASLFFYGWWDVRFVGLLLGSIGFNYGAGYLLAQRRARWLLISAIMVNLSLLAYFKYANFFVTNINALTETHITMAIVVLPLGISFFTFTQLAFLVDTYQGKVKEYNVLHYTLFVTYFPHLIAGPVLHHKDMMPQFAQPSVCRFNYDNIMIGLVIFFIGLFKKVVLADSLAVSVLPVFSATMALSFLDAWGGALCYSLQLYFDFSGYSDMAIGLSRLFGVALPLNFHSPYKAINIIDFWRRWHITLSRFLRDYLYIPLGGNRHGRARRYVNLLVTMLLGGFWHGANWTYLLWGGLHGVYLIINHGWHSLRRHAGQQPDALLSTPLQILATLVTFLAVVVAWVVFRADTVTSATAILKAMAGLNGVGLPETWLLKWGIVGQFLATHGVNFNATAPLIKGVAAYWLLAGLLIVWFAPNTQQIMANVKPALTAFAVSDNTRWQWQPTYPWLFASVVCAVTGILFISKLSEFIYFQF